MLKKTQLTALYEYTKYLRFMTEKIIREAENSRSLNTESKASILQEQKRRLRELSRLERALEAEIGTFASGNETAPPKPRAAHSKAKPKGSTSRTKSKQLAVDTDDAKHSAKQKPGRPRKAQSETAKGDNGRCHAETIDPRERAPQSKKPLTADGNASKKPTKDRK